MIRLGQCFAYLSVQFLVDAYDALNVDRILDHFQHYFHGEWPLRQTSSPKGFENFTMQLTDVRSLLYQRPDRHHLQTGDATGWINGNFARADLPYVAVSTSVACWKTIPSSIQNCGMQLTSFVWQNSAAQTYLENLIKHLLFSNIASWIWTLMVSNFGK